MLKYQKFQAPISKWDVLSKKDQMSWFMQKPNEKLLSCVIILWEVIYSHFYNWNRLLDFLSVVYDLIELIIEVSLWSEETIPHLTLTHNTQDFDSMNAYLICVIVHVQMWCVCSNTCWSNLKRFLSVLFVFESDFILSCLMFLFKMHFCVFLQKLVQRLSRKKLVT